MSKGSEVGKGNAVWQGVRMEGAASARRQGWALSCGNCESPCSGAYRGWCRVRGHVLGGWAKFAGSLVPLGTLWHERAGLHPGTESPGTSEREGVLTGGGRARTYTAL